ncbi:hypothetical protein [Caulobacter sp. LjRoot300]|uniref:hypothetical protein n=1 Tax=Caulobacter sp. LjRoot300 TaxID=3342321 RepID=UPI003ECC6BED
MKALGGRSKSALLVAGSVIIAGAILLAQAASWVATLSIGDGVLSGRRFGLFVLAAPALPLGSAASAAYVYALWCSRRILKEVGQEGGFSMLALSGMARAGWALAAGGAIQSAFAIAMSSLSSRPPNLDALGILMLGVIVAIFAKALITQSEQQSYIDEF